MNVLVIRHAIAEDRDVFARTEKDDDERPLTDEGRKKMARGAQGLHTLVPKLDLIASSPLVRAQQTAAIVAMVCGPPPDGYARWTIRVTTEETKRHGIAELPQVPAHCRQKRRLLHHLIRKPGSQERK